MPPCVWAVPPMLMAAAATVTLQCLEEHAQHTSPLSGLSSRATAAFRASPACCRVHALMRLGKKDIPLVADAEPVDILYEDEWLVAVNAPPGVPSGPKHRFMVRPRYPAYRASSVPAVCAWHACCVRLACLLCALGMQDAQDVVPSTHSCWGYLHRQYPSGFDPACHAMRA